MERKYVDGQIVFAIVKPEVKLIIRRYVSKIYYCKTQGDLALKDLVYFEGELLPEVLPV